MPLHHADGLRIGHPPRRLGVHHDHGVVAHHADALGVLADPAIAAHHGRVVKTTGDGILIEFTSVVDAGHRTKI